MSPSPNSAASAPNASGAAVRAPAPQAAALVSAAVGLAGVGLAADAAGGEAAGATLLGALALGAFGGLALYHAAFGFTAAWRRLQRERRGAGVRAQLLLLALVAVVSFPLIDAGAAGAWVFPLGLAPMLGAAMFGFGMQLGGGCGSGTLFTVGGGSTRMVVTLAAFIAGSLAWTGTREIWAGLPATGGVSLLREIGLGPALGLTLAALAALAAATLVLERRRHGGLEAPLLGRDGWLPRSPRAWVVGPWPLPFGAAALALVVIGCFLWLGRPWGITSAFPLWGAKIADGLGLPVRDWAAWQGGALDRSVFADATGVMNFGILLGALAAAALAGRFAPVWRLTPRDLATAVLGGLLMGYGARLSYGCNIGGLIGGVASASLHGWSWLLFGALGSCVGVLARARLGMDPPAPPPTAPRHPKETRP